MINGLVLFAKTGGSSLALEGISRTVAYHEPELKMRIDLRFKIEDSDLPCGEDKRGFPIIREEFGGKHEFKEIDIIHGSLPTAAEYARIVKRELGEESRKSKCFKRCAKDGENDRVGQEAESRSLYNEICELAKEIQPTFLFFELRPSEWKRDNTRKPPTWGPTELCIKLTRLGYDCRWDTLSAYDVGSPQKRERVYLLARKRKEVTYGDVQVCRGEQSRTIIRQVLEYTCNSIQDATKLYESKAFGTVERTPERVAEVKSGLAEICVPQYREAFLRLAGLKEKGE